MLKLKPDPTFKAKVLVPIPGGESQPVVFEFKHKTRDDFRKWIDRPAGESDVQEILAIAVGWDLADPFDAEHVGLMVQNYYGSPMAVVQAYIEELTKARQGN